MQNLEISKLKAKRFGYEMEPHVLLPLVSIFLHHRDFVSLCSTSHAFNDPAYTECCWDQLVRRDFSKIARYLHEEDHKSTYIRAYRLRMAWKSGRSLVPVSISRKFCALNDQGFGMFYLRDTYRTNFTFTHGELKENDLYKDWSDITGDWIQSISDCAVSDAILDVEHENILVACCGLGGAFVHDYDGVNTPQKVTFPPSTHQACQSTPNKVVFGQNTLGIVGVGLDQSLAIYDVNRLDQPVFYDVQSEPNVESSLCLYVNDNNVTVAYSSGTLVDYDLRIKSRLKQHYWATLRAFTVAKHDNNYRYFATPEACYMTDLRIARDFDRSAVQTWLSSGISCLAAPLDNTVVLGFDSQFSDPLMSLTVDHAPRHLFFASEKYYRVSWLKCTNSVLLAGCTDLIRLFDFSIDPKPKYSSRGS